MNGQRKPEIGGESGGDLAPVFSVVGTAIDAAMILLKEHGESPPAEEELVDALAEFRIFFGKKFGARAVVGEVPALARRPRCEKRRRRRCRRTCVAAACCQSQWNAGKGRRRRDASGGRVGCWVRVATSFQFWPPSSVRKRAAGATPAKRTPGWLAWPASRCQMRSSLTPDCSGNFRGSVGARFCPNPGSWPVRSRTRNR